MTPDTASVTELRREVLAGLTERERIVAADGRSLRPGDEQALGRQLIVEAMDRRARAAIGAGRSVLPGDEEDELSRAVFDALFGLDRLQRLLDDPAIENINADGCDVVWVRYAVGGHERVEPIADSDDEMI